MGPRDFGTPFCGLLNIPALHVQYRIQALAKFKRPECTRLHCRELHFQKIFPEEHSTETPSKSAPFAVLLGAIAPLLQLYIISLGPLYRIILRPPLYSAS